MAVFHEEKCDKCPLLVHLYNMHSQNPPTNNNYAGTQEGVVIIIIILDRQSSFVASKGF